MQSVKCVVLGDGCVGTRTMVTMYTKNVFPMDYVPTIIEESIKDNLEVDGKLVSLHIWNLAGQEGCQNLRTPTYTQTDVFVVCFSLVSPPSLSNVELYWLPEIRQHCPSTPIILVGTKVDLIDSAKSRRVTNSLGRAMSLKIGAIKYLECSSLLNVGVNEVFDEAVRAAFKEEPQDNCCAVCTII